MFGIVNRQLPVKPVIFVHDHVQVALPVGVSLTEASRDYRSSPRGEAPDDLGAAQQGPPWRCSSRCTFQVHGREVGSRAHGSSLRGRIIRTDLRVDELYRVPYFGISVAPMLAFAQYQAPWRSVVAITVHPNSDKRREGHFRLYRVVRLEAG